MIQSDPVYLGWRLASQNITQHINIDKNVMNWSLWRSM